MPKSKRPPRILVVSNRSDRQLQRALGKKLGARITWVVHKPRRIQSVAKAVKNGRFDTVILITGFLDHKTTDIIGAAAKKSETPIVRANRGRMSAVEQALERDLKDAVRQTDQGVGQDGLG